MKRITPEKWAEHSAFGLFNEPAILNIETLPYDADRHSDYSIFFSYSKDIVLFLAKLYTLCRDTPHPSLLIEDLASQIATHTKDARLTVVLKIIDECISVSEHFKVDLYYGNDAYATWLDIHIESLKSE